MFLQYQHGESFLGQNSSTPPGSWLSHRLPGSTGPTAAPGVGVGSTSSSTIPGIPGSGIPGATNPNSFVDTGLSPPPSSNNSAVDEQPQLKPLHINNNIPSSYPNSTSTGLGGQHVNTNTPTPPSSSEAISPSSVSSGKPFPFPVTVSSYSKSVKLLKAHVRLLIFTIFSSNFLGEKSWQRFSIVI